MVHLAKPNPTLSKSEAMHCPGPLGKDLSVAKIPLGQKSGLKARGSVVSSPFRAVAGDVKVQEEKRKETWLIVGCFGS